MYITPPIQLTFEHSSRSNAVKSANPTFKGLPKYEPDVFDLRPDFNQAQSKDAGLRTIDFMA